MEIKVRYIGMGYCDVVIDDSGNRLDLGTLDKEGRKALIEKLEGTIDELSYNLEVE